MSEVQNGTAMKIPHSRYTVTTDDIVSGRIEGGRTFGDTTIVLQRFLHNLRRHATGSKDDDEVGEE